MNKYISTLIFYVAGLVVIYGLSLISPGQQDGGPGWNSVAVIVLSIFALILTIVNAVKGFKSSKDHFIVAGIHLIVFLGLVFTLFL